VKNYIQHGDSIDIIAPEKIFGGSLVTVNSLVGVAETTSDTDLTTDLIALSTTGVFNLPKTTGALALGAKVMVPAGAFSNNVSVRADAGNGIYVGVVVEAVLSAATTVKVKINA
jgi:predicted RecA/RadA family phage recombinase